MVDVGMVDTEIITKFFHKCPTCGKEWGHPNCIRALLSELLPKYDYGIVDICSRCCGPNQFVYSVSVFKDSDADGIGIEMDGIW